MKKKLLLSAVLAMSIVSAGAVNAADITNWAGLKTNKDEANINFSNDITADGATPDSFPSPITFTSAIDQVIDGNYHSFSSNDIYKESDDSWYSYSLNISKTGGSLGLKNLGKFSDGSADNSTFSYVDLDGNTVYKSIEASVNNWKRYFLTIAQPLAVNITNSVFTDNGYDRDARLIYVSSSSAAGTLNVSDSIFYNNKMANAGPVIYSNKFNLNIENSIFYGNKNTPAAGSTQGGAILTAGGKVKIKDSYFINNIAKNRASSSIKGKGGAVYIAKGSGHVIENSKFEGNTSFEEGGAVYVYYNATTDYVKNSQFIGNMQTGDSSYGGGGGLSFGGGYVKAIEQCLFDNNSTGTKGGGLYIEELTDTPSDKKLVLVKDSDFKNNTAELGGGMYFSADYGINDKFAAQIVDSDFTSNSASQGGGLFVNNGDAAIISAAKDVTFSGNTASDAGDDIYIKTNTYASTLFLNAEDEKKITFNGTIMSGKKKDTSPDSAIDINKTGITYSTYSGDTETVNNAGTTGEIQFNNQVGDSNNSFNINLYGGTLSIGQNAANNADGYINNNNFYVKGDSILNTANNLIGEFSPKVFDIDNGVTLDYKFDVDLANTKSDKIKITNNNGSLKLSSFNVISDSNEEELKVKYSDENVNGVIKDDYTITTSKKTYEVTAENSSEGSFVIFSKTEEEGGLPSAIISQADQYVITDGKDENVPAWDSSVGNIIKHDMDIDGNGHSIFTENGLDGMIVSSGKDVKLRNINKLSGFNNAITNDGGTLSIIDTNITGNTGTADVTNIAGTVIIDAATKDVAIGSDKTDNALLSNGGTVDVKGDNKVTFAGAVKGTKDAKMNISTDTAFNGKVSDMNITQEKGTVDVKDLSGAVYTLNDGTLNLKKSGKFAPNTFELNNGTVNISDESGFSPKANIFTGGNINAINSKTGNLNFNSLTLRNIINLAVDVDLDKQIMDTITASSVKGAGTIKVNEFNILSDTNEKNISIYFANDKIRNFVSTDVDMVEGKIYNYDLSYDKQTGRFNFSSQGSSSDDFSPSVMASPIAAQLGGYFTQLNSYDEAFRNMDMYMLLTSEQRQALKNKNKIASLDGTALYDETLMRQEKAEGWVRPYATFEKVPLKNGPKVSNVMYGTFIGGESEMYDLGHGWDGIWGVYVGYNGSHQAYNGISMYQNGGTLGVIGMAYKGNFFQGLTVNTGANAGEASTNFGNDDFTMLMAGVASKTGYNWELFNNHFIIQPSMLMSYSFINTFDYTNAAGVRIDSDPLHAIQLQPQLKLIGNLKNGWQPYASVAMVWNIMDDTKFKANDVSLPEVSVKPFVKYGAGVRKTWGERFTGFFQTYVTNGGRNGVGLQAGFTWTLGK